LFLDEIGDLPIDVQPKLLRFLELQEIMPIGDTRPQRVDVRVLAATNADLEQRVAEGKFREVVLPLERDPHPRAAPAR
jgi:transcriptional regulator with GAF, ATPase, and Fis domain